MSHPTSEPDPDAVRTPEPPRDARTPRRLLFVCTGNTCRSPMAAVIARDLAAKRGMADIEVRSAGAGAFPGAPPSGGAVRVALARDLELASHRATLLTREDIEWADLILTMSHSHLARVHALGGGPRASLLTAFADGVPTRGDAASIPDPIGGSDAEYEVTFRQLEALVRKALDRISEASA